MLLGILAGCFLVFAESYLRPSNPFDDPTMLEIKMLSHARRRRG